MKARLYCNHCETHYEIELEAIRRIQAIKTTQFTFSRNTYYYDDDRCFLASMDELDKETKKLDEC